MAAALPPNRRRPRAQTNAATYTASRSSSRSDEVASSDQNAETPGQTERARSAPPNQSARRGIQRTPSRTSVEAASSAKAAIAHGHEPRPDPPLATPSASREAAAAAAAATRRSRVTVAIGATSRD